MLALDERSIAAREQVEPDRAETNIRPDVAPLPDIDESTVSRNLRDQFPSLTLLGTLSDS